MSWLRLDDGFPSHPKLDGWTSAQKWGLIELLCYCARHKTEGVVPSDLALLPRAVTPRLIGLAETAGILDREEDGHLVVHDWTVYNPADPSAADRMKRWRSTNPRVDTGKWAKTRKAVFERDRGICVDCGKDCSEPRDGRDIWNADHDPPRVELERMGVSIYDLDYIFTRCHSCHARKTRRQSQERTQSEHEPNYEPNESVSSRARLPSPSSKDSLPPTSTSDGEGLNTGKELLVVRLLSLLGDVPDEKTQAIRSLAERAPDVVTVRLIESLPSANVRDRVAYAIGTYRRELAA